MIINSFFGTFISTAQAATINTSFQDLTITPKTAAFGQTITFVAAILPKPPSGYSYRGIMLSVIDSNGNYRDIGFSNDTQPGTGAFTLSWTPDIQGTYVCIITYQGETLADNDYARCQIKSWFTVGTPTPTTSQTPIPLLTPKPTSASSSTPPVYYPTETPNKTTFDLNTESQVAIHNLPIYIILSVVAADIVALMVLGVRHFKKRKIIT